MESIINSLGPNGQEYFLPSKAIVHEGKKYYLINKKAHTRVDIGERYYVSLDGKVFDSVTSKIKKQFGYTQNEYRYISINLNGKATNVSIHRIMTATFIVPIEGRTIVNHINGIKTDNSLHNLEWSTHSLNGKHACAMGLKYNPPSKYYVRDLITGRTFSGLGFLKIEGFSRQKFRNSSRNGIPFKYRWVCWFEGEECPISNEDYKAWLTNNPYKVFMVKDVWSVNYVFVGKDKFSQLTDYDVKSAQVAVKRTINGDIVRKPKFNVVSGHELDLPDDSLEVIDNETDITGIPIARLMCPYIKCTNPDGSVHYYDDYDYVPNLSESAIFKALVSRKPTKDCRLFEKSFFSDQAFFNSHS